MAAYDEIYEVAADNHGLITSAQARALGISDKEMSRLAGDGRLTRLGYGVYLIRHHVPEASDPYAVSVALVGDGAYLYGESVLAMHGLCPTDPRRMYVATPRRVRRTLSPGLVVVRRRDVGDVTTYDAVPSQTVAAAIASCVGSVLPERLRQAMAEARRQGLVSTKELADLEGMVG